MDVNIFKKLFVHRDDVYSLQSKSGGYFTQTRPLQPQNIQDHLQGENTLGLYQLKKEGEEYTVKWAVLDIDIKKKIYSPNGADNPNFNVADFMPVIDQQVKVAIGRLNNHQIPYYIEESGFKGKHIWVFFEKPINAGLAKAVFKELFGDMVNVSEEEIAWEIFPKQATVSEGGFGNLVKGPLGKHNKSGRFSHFINLDEENIKYATEAQMRKIAGTKDPYSAVIDNCPAFTTLKNKAYSSGHLTHHERLALAYVFTNLSKKGEQYLEDKILSYCDDYKPTGPDSTQYYFDHMRKKDYKPITCAKLQSDAYENICGGKCELIKSGKSPIVYYYRALGDAEKEEAVNVAISADAKIDNYFMTGNKYYERTFSEKQGEKTKLISNYIIRLDEEIIFDDGLKKEKWFRGVIVFNNNEYPFEINADDWASDQQLEKAVINTLGASGPWKESIVKVRDISMKYNKTDDRIIKKIFGYDETLLAYYTPSTKITAEKIEKNNDIQIDLSAEDKAKYLDVMIGTAQEERRLKEHVKRDLLKVTDEEATMTALAHTMVPALAPLLGVDEKRYIYMLKGTTGSGKSNLMIHMQHFYGKFPSVVSWTGTAWSLQKIGYFFKDAMYLVDDFKRSNLDRRAYNAALSIMQNYADNTGRSRLSSDTKLKDTYPIKGWLATTGEDTIEGEASNLARMITINLPPIPKKDIQKNRSIERMRDRYSVLTGKYIQFLLRQDPEKIRSLYDSYFDLYYSNIKGQINDTRIAKNIALITLSFDLFSRYLWEDEEERLKELNNFKEIMNKKILIIIAEVSEETAGNIFLDALNSQLTGKYYYIQEGPSLDDNALNKGVSLGYYMKDNTVCLKWNEAYLTVQRYLRDEHHGLQHSKGAVLDELYARGIALDKKSKSRKINGKNIRTVKLILDDSVQELEES